MKTDIGYRSDRYTWMDLLSDFWKHLLAMILAVLIAIALLGTSYGSSTMPDGVWICEMGLCVSQHGIQRRGNKVHADALISDRGAVHRSTLVRDCITGVTTSIGVPGLAEDWPLQNTGFKWLCDREVDFR